ncbi:hypothetical protein BGX29_001283 [Mortierella sp. GBA35]|nr:hypothetical protein BGX29_001283 [Mortierella sp. GBA35]
MQQTGLTGLEPPSPVGIPELLERILSYVDKRTLTNSAIRVSRQWLSIGRQFATVEYAWSDCIEDTDKLKRALTMLPWMSRLQWHMRSSSQVASYGLQGQSWLMASSRKRAVSELQERQWLLLLTALEKIAADEAVTRRSYGRGDQRVYNYFKQIRTPIYATTEDLPTAPARDRLAMLTAGPRTQLREFELYGDINVGNFRLLSPLLWSLTRLKIACGGSWHSSRYSPNHIDIRLVLLDCPHLEDLHFSSTPSDCKLLPGPWIPVAPEESNPSSSPPYSSAYAYAYSSSSPNPSTSPSVPDPAPASDNYDGSLLALQLRSLVLDRMAFDQAHLESLFPYTPRLRVLKVINASLYASPSNRDNVPFNLAQFVAATQCLFKSRGFRFDSFHFSTQGRSYDRMMMSIYPESQERAFWTRDLTPNIAQSIRQQTNIITTLELLFDYEFGERCQPEALLHNYLCSSPHLLHLKARQTRYAVEHMDLHGRLVGHPSMQRKAAANEIPFLPGIWQCRRLKTLHLRIMTPDKTEGHGNTTIPSSEFSLVAYGYIARVCPELQDLCFGNGRAGDSYPPLDIRLQGGFCLLGRLRYLERLEVERWWNTGHLTPRNFEWMIASGRTEEMKAKRRRALRATWKQLGIFDGGTIDGTGTNGHFDWTNVDPVLREELRCLGLPIEVKAFFDELDAPGQDGGVLCFPALRYSSICSLGGLELPLERDVKRLIFDRLIRPW